MILKKFFKSDEQIVYCRSREKSQSTDQRGHVIQHIEKNIKKI